MYPKTMEDLKLRALERREFFLTNYRKAESERKKKLRMRYLAQEDG